MAEILIASAAVSNYEGMDALVGQDGRVYLGRQENYFPSIEDGVPAYYDNSDNSLQLVSDNVRIFHLLYALYFEELSERQLADKLGIHYMTVHNRKARLLRVLKKMMNK